MTRSTEAVLLAAAALLAAFGTTLVNVAGAGTLDAQVGLTFAVFAIAFGALHLAVRRWAASSTTNLLPLVALLAAFGLIEIYRLDPERAGLQRWWLLIASGAAMAVLVWLHRAGTSALRRYRNLMFAVAIGLLLLPLLPTDWSFPLRGFEANGSRLWIELDVGILRLNFQPGEVAKLAFVIFLAAYLADRQMALTEASRRIGPFAVPEPRQLLPLLVVWAGSLGVLVGQRDLGASLLLFAVVVTMLYAATGHGGYLTGGAVLGLLGAGLSWVAFDHVQRRMDAWIRPFSVFEDAGYQVAQGIFGLGTGSIAGSGPGLGRPDLIPFAETDFILAAFGEEFGFGGSAAVLATYALFIAVGFGIALRSRDRFRKLLAAGLVLAFGIQTFLIVGGVLRVVPLTGITLPFMSYGGSSLLGNFMLVALLLRVSHEEDGG
jgi:cell division protein FtsW (lipid II flippase)